MGSSLQSLNPARTYPLMAILNQVTHLRRAAGAALVAAGLLGALTPVVHAAAVAAASSDSSHVERSSERSCAPAHDEPGCPVCKSLRLPALAPEAAKPTASGALRGAVAAIRASDHASRARGTIEARSPPMRQSRPA